MDSLPVPLLIQCLLYLIGNLFDDDDKPIPGLALLPRSIRIKLLLLLPAVDVHKLEGTSVTADIVMDEIWETLYKERNKEMEWNQLLDEYNSRFSCKDVYFSAAMVHPRTSYLMFYEANKELSVYFTHVKESVYDDYYKIATFHNVIWAQHRYDVYYRVFITTKTFKSKALSFHYDPFEVLALTMIDLHIPLKIVTNHLFPLDHEILIKLTQSAEAIHWIGSCCWRICCWRSCIDIENIFKIIFLENKCRIISCTCTCDEDSCLLVLLDYLQQQCDLRILNMDAYLTSQEAAKFQEVIKHHKNLEVVSVGYRTYHNDYIQCLSELMYRPCFQELTIESSSESYTFFNGVHSLLSAFFLSPYPVTLKLDKVYLTLDSTDLIPVPSLALNTEQQSKSLDVGLYVRLDALGFSDASRILESNFLPQYIVLKSLKIRSNTTLCLFSNSVKSIKADEITIHINTNTDANSLRSLLSSVSTNDMKIFVSVRRPNLYQPSYEVIFDSLSPTKPPYLQLIVKYSGDDPSPILIDTWKRCGAIKLKKAVIVDRHGREKDEYIEEMM